MQSLIKDAKISRAMDQTAAGSSDVISGDILDMQEFDTVLGMVVLGDVTTTAVLTLKAYIGDEPALGDGAYSAVTATVTADATSADNKILALEIKKPQGRYIRFDLVRATANAVVECGVALQSLARFVPVTQSTDVVDSDFAVDA
jgi:hypothetical protein